MTSQVCIVYSDLDAESKFILEAKYLNSQQKIHIELNSTSGENKVNGQVIKEMHGRIVKNFMDILIMTELKNSPMSGYDAISFIHKKFRLLISSGTVYSLLYSLERAGFIEGKFNNRKRVYVLTQKGEETIQEIQEASEQIQTFMLNLLKRFNNTKSLKEDLDTVVYSN